MDKANCGPISLQRNLPKVLEKSLYKQLYPFFDKFFSIQQCGFLKGYSAQHCIIRRLIEKRKQCLDQSLVFGVLLSDLSKAFDCLSHKLLAAKLNAYGLETSAVRLIFDYMTNRKQRTKAYGKGIGVSQGLILGPLLFSIYLCDIFLLTSNIDMASYADATTPFVYGQNMSLTSHYKKLLICCFSGSETNVMYYY